MAYDFSPDSTAHPNAVHLGGTETGITTSIKGKLTDIKLDQFDGPIDRYAAEEAIGLEATLAQLDPKIMQYCYPLGVFSTTGSGATAVSQLTFGGPVPGQVTPACIAAIAKSAARAGLLLHESFSWLTERLLRCS